MRSLLIRDAARQSGRDLARQAAPDRSRFSNREGEKRGTTALSGTPKTGLNNRGEKDSEEIGTDKECSVT